MLGTYVPFIHLILTKTFGGRWLCPHFTENKQAERGGEGPLSVAVMVSGAEEGVMDTSDGFYLPTLWKDV